VNDNIFMGNALCPVDADGALSLPLFARVMLARRKDGGTIFLGSHEADTCLVAYHPDRAIEAQAEGRRPVAEQGSAPRQSPASPRRIFGFLASVPIDAEGRCVLPPMLRRRARIGEAALVIGTGETFEIWSPRIARYGRDPDMRALAADRLDFQRAA